jgi:mono/diheme cytochrome c family protein
MKPDRRRMTFMKPLVLIALAAALFDTGYGHCAAQDQPATPAAAPTVAPTIETRPVTFNKNIAPILFRHCVECHRPGEVAPFSLLTYDDAKKRAAMIQTVTTKGIMPPWKSVPGHGSFVGERRLAAEEIELIARWVKQGKPEGDPQDLPAAPRFTQGWKLGQPDITVTMPSAYEIPAEGPDIYRNFVFALDIPKGKYIKAAEYRPSNRKVVHHAVLALDVTGQVRKDDDADPAPGFAGNASPPGQLFVGSLATWTPGRDPMPLPDGMSMPWKAGADFVLQLHLHPSGKPEVEQSIVGFHLTDQPPQRSMVDVVLIDKKIDIPPGERTYRTRAQLTVPIDVETVGVFPHMHLIGRQFKLTAHPPQGEPFPMLLINDWDFNWQVYYQYAAPMKLAAGTRIVMEAVHDNSAENIRNPNQPPKRVTWGEQTTDEMSLAFLQLMPVREEEFGKLGVREGGKLGVIRAAARESAP